MKHKKNKYNHTKVHHNQIVENQRCRDDLNSNHNFFKPFHIKEQKMRENFSSKTKQAKKNGTIFLKFKKSILLSLHHLFNPLRSRLIMMGKREREREGNWFGKGMQIHFN